MKYIYLFVFAILLSACATPYQENGLTGGFTETQLDVNVFKVTFRGNGYTNRERAADFALLRSAELALEHGYSYFAIVDSGQHSTNSTYTTPSTTYSSASAYGNTAYGSSTTSGHHTYLISKPNATNTIICFKEKPQGFSYNAEFIRKSLRAKYELDKSKK